MISQGKSAKTVHEKADDPESSGAVCALCAVFIAKVG